MISRNLAVQKRIALRKASAQCRFPLPAISRQSPSAKPMKKVVGATRSTSRLRYVLSLGLALCALSQQSVWSQDLAARQHEDARLCGFFPCPQTERQVEPNAGKWKTWLLEDVRQVRPSAPPPRSISEREIGVLKRLSFRRDAVLDSHYSRSSNGRSHTPCQIP